MNILILGSSRDVEATHVMNALTQAGAVVNYLDTLLFPTQIQLSWEPNTQAGCLTLPGGCQLNLQDIKSVYWRNFCTPYIPSLKDPAQQKIAFSDSMSVLRSLIQACPALWVNSWQAYQFHKEKPLQLSKVKEIGVKIPATLIGNDPDRVLEFSESHPKTIFKPVYGGTHTQLLTDFHLDRKRLSLALKLSPVTIQEYIPGTNIRSYVIADSVYSAEIRTHSIDFREDSTAELIPVNLPESVQKQCLAIAKVLMLEWTAIDWRLNLEGEYVFLEANPSPMFVNFEHQTGFPITQELVKLLM
ncbi:MAG: hypothetical protein PUP91_26045 [Rhizonema sp. PD37]|nr:hypothetical protein [Rhizonema sp. PD37]